MMIPKNKPVRLKGKAYTEFRREVYNQANGICSDCGMYAPLVDPISFCFEVFTCGHVSHIKSRGAGGGDTMDNVRWKCYSCHILKEHGLKFSGGGD